MMSSLLPPAPLSVTELNAIARQLLEDQLDGLWISGEISNLTRATSGHYYFTLKDTRAQVRCVLFKHVAYRANTLRDGDHIELSGKISLYEARGEFQITVSEIRTVGLGSLYERYEQLKATLRQQGLFDAECKRDLPDYPRKIGVVTSLATAALRDVVSTLKRRAPHIPIIVYPTAVQGAGSEQQIAQAIELANQRAEVDVVIVCRGGGSIEDLWAFNEEVVVRAIAESALPIVSGVGHETDTTLSDFVADVRAPTPTAAAELVSPNREDAILQVRQFAQKIHHHAWQRYQNASQTLDFTARQLRHPRETLAMQSKYIQQLATQLAHYRPNIQMPQMRIHQLHQQLRHQAHQQLNRQQLAVQHQAHLLEALSPHHVLARGYAIVHNTQGEIIRDAHALKLGQKLRITLAQGETEVRVADQNNGDLFD